MIGQSNILQKFNCWKKIPSSVLLLAPTGYGKKTLVKELANNIGVSIINIDKSLSDDMKNSLYLNSNPSILLIDTTNDLQYRQVVSLQNSMLKFIEELPINYKLFLLAENESFVLDTILNRCYIQVMQEYSNKELLELASLYNEKLLHEYSDECFKYIKSPRDIMRAPSIKELQEIEVLVDTMFSSIGIANISNILSISKKINFDNSVGLYDLEVFLNVFNCKLVTALITDYDEKYFRIFTAFNDLLYNINKANISKVNMFENFLLYVKQIMI